MSQISPFLLAYRQSLRDVQHAVLMYGQAISDPVSTSSAVFVAADCMSEPLKLFRESGAGSLDAKIFEPNSIPLTKQTEFIQGYLAGFDTSVDLVASWGRKMNNPAARDAIGDAVTRLRHMRSQITVDENGKLRTLRTRKFVLTI